ncbi:arginase family protein [Nonomuraea soli]|uniref:Arginase n=1 Tax=Nonomuraea soli TaxID=1032476 RepID=A0A7W0CQZ4_9ACTN|nr:arginase family protein [Nonomuraea soli]MBA2895535.1 arginase [Nonomuraea soli]
MHVLEVPQWQGSGAPTARRLAEGAALLAGMVPYGTRLRVPVDEESSVDGIAASVRSMLPPGPVLTVGGDCSVDLVPVARAVSQYGARLKVFWFDAHGDLNTPESSPSGAFHGMVLRTLTGTGPASLVPDTLLDPERIVLAGVRDLDPGEQAYVASSGITHLRDTSGLESALAPGDVAYIHIDLDVLDPGVFSSVGTPAPGGLQPGELLDAVAAIASVAEVVGMAITEYEPSSAADQELLVPLVRGLTSAFAASKKS